MPEATKHVKEWIRGNGAPPYVIQFNIMDGCNLNCVFCEVPEESRQMQTERMKDEEYYRIIEEAGKMGVKEIRLCGGGEPLLKKDRAMNMIRLAKKSKMTCRLITNGTLLTESDIRELVQIGLDDIQFSVMGTDSETHNSLVKTPGAFQKTTGNIIRFAEEKKKQSKDKPFTSIYFILNKKNIGEASQIPSMLSRLKANRFGLYDVDIRTPDCQKIRLDETERAALRKSGEIERIKQAVQALGTEFYAQETLARSNTQPNETDQSCSGKDCQKNKSDCAQNEKKEQIQFPDKISEVLGIMQHHPKDLFNVPCYEPWYYLGIRSDGMVELCPNIRQDRLSIRGKTLQEIWQGEYMTQVREIILQRKPIGLCNFCCNLEMTVPIRDELKKERR